MSRGNRYTEMKLNGKWVPVWSVISYGDWWSKLEEFGWPIDDNAHLSLWYEWLETLDNYDNDLIGILVGTGEPLRRKTMDVLGMDAETFKKHQRRLFISAVTFAESKINPPEQSESLNH